MRPEILTAEIRCETSDTYRWDILGCETRDTYSWDILGCETSDTYRWDILGCETSFCINSSKPSLLCCINSGSRFPNILFPGSLRLASGNNFLIWNLKKSPLFYQKWKISLLLHAFTLKPVQTKPWLNMNPLWNELKIKSKCKIHFVFCKFSLFLTFLWNSKELSEECWSWTRAMFHVINTLFPILSQIFRRLLWVKKRKLTDIKTNHHFN